MKNAISFPLLILSPNPQSHLRVVSKKNEFTKKIAKEAPQGISDERLSELKCLVRHCPGQSAVNVEDYLSQISFCNDDDDFFKQLKDKLGLKQHQF